MKARSWGIAAALFVSMVAAGQCRAQELRVQIPFAFVVGNATMPAGEYQIDWQVSQDAAVQLIRSTDGSDAQFLLTNAAAARNDSSEPRLIFHRYGHEYFLSQMWIGGETGRQLRTSKREKELARGEEPNEVAVLIHVPAAGR